MTLNKVSKHMVPLVLSRDKHVLHCVLQSIVSDMLLNMMIKVLTQEKERQTN
jgi:hypothetical protein